MLAFLATVHGRNMMGNVAFTWLFKPISLKPAGKGGLSSLLFESVWQ
jgi:hypothetical protein